MAQALEHCPAHSMHGVPSVRENLASSHVALSSRAMSMRNLIYALFPTSLRRHLLHFSPECLLDKCVETF